MTPHAERVLERFRALDRLLQTKGFPATSPWWHETIERWYRSGKRQLCARAGRRAGKSSTLSRLGVVEALYGDHKIPPGDTGVVAIISTRREEAAERIATVKAILDALGVRYSPWGEHGVKVEGRRIGFRVYTASISGVSGFTGIFVFADEVAKWKDSDTGTNPATEVLKSVRPTMATQPNARIIMSSSPMGKFDAHYDAFEEGETPLQITAHAASWIANPSITEEDTHILEPDTSTWEREYAAIPQAEIAESLFTDAELDAATRVAPATVEREDGVTYAAAIDPGTRGNAWTLAIGALRFVGDVVKRSIVHAQEWRGSTAQPLSPKAVLTEIKPMLAAYGTDTLWTDQASGDALRDIAADLGLVLVIEPWTQASKLTSYKNLQTWVRADQLELSPAEHVKHDLLGVRRKYTRSGVTIDLLKTPDGRHADYAPAIALCASRLYTDPQRPVAPAAVGSVAWIEAGRERRQRALVAKQEQAERQPWLGERSINDRGARARWRAR